MIGFVARKWPPSTGGLETCSLKHWQALVQHATGKLIALLERPDGSPPSVAALVAFGVLAAWNLLTTRDARHGPRRRQGIVAAGARCAHALTTLANRLSASAAERLNDVERTSGDHWLTSAIFPTKASPSPGSGRKVFDPEHYHAARGSRMESDCWVDTAGAIIYPPRSVVRDRSGHGRDPRRKDRQCACF